jgi:hypothetical protein
LETEVTRLTAENILTDEIIEYIADKVVEIQKAEQEDKSMLRYYEQQLRETKSALNNIVKAIEAGLITATTKTRLFELEEQKATLEGEIEREKIIAPIINKEQVIFFLKRFRRQIIEAFVNKALLYDDKIIITYNISNDSNELSAEIVENAAFAAECECSSLLSSSPPFIEKTNTTIFFVGGIFGIVTTLHY